MGKNNASILIVDDDQDILFTADMFLKRHFAQIHTLEDPNNIEKILSTSSIDLVLLDMNFALGLNTGAEGLHWLQRILSIVPDMVVVLMTAYGDVGLSVEAIKQGATDFVLKPWKNEKLLATLNAALLLSDSRKQVSTLTISQQALQKEKAVPDVIGQSSALQHILKQVEKVAKTEANILILGENGVGKDVIAQQIYHQSHRADSIMLSVDLGAIPESLFESELFGHVKGAFTDAHSDRAGRFQAASGGTLFLDEIGNLPIHLQAKLLRVLEQKCVSPVGSDKIIPVDVRLICATNSKLKKLVDDGKFRADLYYRINTIELSVPPLRERAEDISLLVEYFAQRYCKKYQLNQKRVSASAIAKLEAYDWPGNIRELAHTVERAVIMSDDSFEHQSNHGFLSAQDFILPQTNNIEYTNRQANPFNDCNLERIEGLAVKYALEKHEGNISQSAKELGITRTSLYRRIKKFGL